MDKTIGQWNYMGLWRLNEIRSNNDFSAFVILAGIESDPANNKYNVKGKGIDNLGVFEVNGNLNESETILTFNKEYIPDVSKKYVLKDIKINAKKVNDYFVGEWTGIGICHDKSVSSGPISLKSLSSLGLTQFFDNQNPEMELFRAHMGLLERRIKELRKEFPYAPPM